MSGCGDDSGGKVINEFLVSKWDCVNKKYESNYSSKFEEYRDYTEWSSKQVTCSYKVVNGVLLTKTVNEETAEVDLNEIYNNLTVESNIDDCEHITTRNLVQKFKE